MRGGPSRIFAALQSGLQVRPRGLRPRRMGSGVGGFLFPQNNPMQSRILSAMRYSHTTLGARRLTGVAATAFAAAVSGAQAASPMTDAEAVALAARHCVACHAEMPTHEAFDKPPKGIRLETIEQLRR